MIRPAFARKGLSVGPDGDSPPGATSAPLEGRRAPGGRAAPRLPRGGVPSPAGLVGPLRPPAPVAGRRPPPHPRRGRPPRRPPQRRPHRHGKRTEGGPARGRVV